MLIGGFVVVVVPGRPPVVNRGVVTRRQKLHYALGMDSRVEHEELKGTLHLRKYNDSNQRAFYRRWLELMCGD